MRTGEKCRGSSPVDALLDPIDDPHEEAFRLNGLSSLSYVFVINFLMASRVPENGIRTGDNEAQLIDR
jgi:hypothetical protein